MLGAISIWHWLVVVLVITVLFGRNVISSTMGDIGQGLRKLRDIQKEED